MFTYAEHLLHVLEISDDMNIDQIKSWYAVSLYTYGMMKQRDVVESEYDRKRLNTNEKGKKKRLI